jgi:hypothetical protein
MTDQTEELLRAGMERFTAETNVPAGLAVKAARHRQRTRRTRAAAAIGAAVTAAAAAAVTAAIVAAPGPAPRLQTSAYVVSRVQGALTQASSQDYIQYRRETTTALIYLSSDVSGPSVGSWTYRGQARNVVYSSDGQVTHDIGRVTKEGRDTTTQVNYQEKTWSRAIRAADTFTTVTPTPESSCDEATALAGGGLGDGDPAGQIRTALSCGQYVVAGTRRVDGVRALELKPAEKGTITTVFWVDPATYLPVRDVTTTSPPTTARVTTITDDFRWLRPTPANLADLDVRIPAGFTQVPPSD